MKTIGILGGMSSASTLVYYQALCDRVQNLMGGLHSPELLIRSVDFAPVADMQARDDWQSAGRLLNTGARQLEAGGADLLVLATNTMHKVADEMMAGVSIPLVHIADATAQAIAQQGLTTPGLMATAFTMEQTFYTTKLLDAGLTPIIPEQSDRETCHRIIFEELCRHRVLESSRLAFEQIAKNLAAAGADALILGCTEIGLLLNEENVPLPVFDTTQLHCDAALAQAMAT